MGRISKTGLYTWEVKSLGVLPGITSQVSTSPTGPVTSQIPTGSRSSAYDSIKGAGVGFVPVGQRDVLAAACRLAAGAVATPRLAAHDLSLLEGALRRMPEVKPGFVSATVMKANMDFALSRVEARMALSDHLNMIWTGMGVASLERRLVDGTYTGFSTSPVSASRSVSLPATAPTLPQSRDLFTMPSHVVPDPSTTALENGATGPDAAATQTQAVLDANNGSGVTPIVQATGPSDSIPGYGVNPVLNDGSSSPVSGLPSWWKPALAIAIGAAVGVGVGRMIAR